MMMIIIGCIVIRDIDLVQLNEKAVRIWQFSSSSILQYDLQFPESSESNYFFFIVF